MRRAVLFSLTVLVAAACLALGIWQLSRLRDRRAVNAQAMAGRELPPLVTDSAASPGLLPHRRAVLTGELDAGHEFLLRNRLVQGVPAVQVITPLRLPGSDTAVLINRGYVPAPNAMDPGLAEWGEPGRRVYRGTLLPMPSRDDGSPIQRSGRETWKGLDLAAMRARLPYPIVPVYLVAEVDSSEGNAHTLKGRVYPFRSELPPMDEGPHLSYALQWFGIAAAVLTFGVVFILRGAHQRGAPAHPPTTGGAW